MMSSSDDCIWRERVMLVVSGEEPETVEVRDHLRECGRCGRLYADLRRLHSVRIPSPPVPQEVHRRIVLAAKEEAAARRRERSRVPAWLRRVPWSVPRLAWAAVFLLALGIGLWQYMRPQYQTAPLLSYELDYGLAVVEMDLGALESEIELSSLDMT